MNVYINPEILKWALRRNRMSIEQLAHHMKKDVEEVRLWESGGKSPSYSALETLAYSVLKIPLAVFLFPEPPDIEDNVTKFRRLPEYEMERLSSDTLQIIRSSQGFQDALVELIGMDGDNRKIFIDIDAKNMAPDYMAKLTREYINISIEEQFKFSGTEAALKAWRHAVEKAGVFTFKNTFKDRYISGFSLLHEQFPIIVINNSNSFSRQIFTLIHELGHILLGIHGITDVDESYINYMSSDERELEIFCNQFAAELLVPREVFENDIPRSFYPSIIGELADKYSVSREVILRRFLEYSVVSQKYYIEQTTEWNRDYLRSIVGKGGDWYRTRLAYLGEGYTTLAFENYHSGRVSKEQLGEYLNINSKNIDKLETYLLR